MAPFTHTLQNRAAPATASLSPLAKQEKAIQSDLDAQTPHTLLLAVMGLLVLCFLLNLPRTIARLWSSLHPDKEITGKKPTLPQGYGSENSSRDSIKSFTSDPTEESKMSFKEDLAIPRTHILLSQAKAKLVGGGDMFRGWFLKRGNDQDQDQVPGYTNIWGDDAHLEGYRQPSLQPPEFVPPRHFGPILQHLPFSSTLLWAPFAKLPSWLSCHVTLAELYIIVAYLMIFGIALIYRSNLSPAAPGRGYGQDYVRSGMVAMSQAPIAVALGVRGNVLGLCIGQGYERLKRAHKIVGRVVFFASALHTGLYLYKFAMAGQTAASLSKPFISAGLASFVGLVLLTLSSIPPIRRMCYSFFKVCHVIGAIGFLIGLALHVPVAVPYCAAAAVFYGISILCSIFKTRVATAQLVAFTESQTTLVVIPGIRTGWRAGQHVRLRVPSLGFPLGLQAHPFTIASAPDGEGLVLLCKVAGDWTEKLFQLASYGPMSINDGGLERGKRTDATVIVEGPYGGLGNTLPVSSSAVMLVAGGSGISHSMSLAHDLISRVPTGVVRPRTIDLVWVVRDENQARPMMGTLTKMVIDAHSYEESCLEGRMQGANLPPPVALRVHLYLTRVPTSSPITLLSPSAPTSGPDFRAVLDAEKSRTSSTALSAARTFKLAYLTSQGGVPPLSVTMPQETKRQSKYYAALSTFTVHKLRPSFDDVVETIIGQVVERTGREKTEPSGLCVLACGPGSLVHAVREAVRKVDGKDKRDVGGLEFEEEFFSF